MITIKSIKIPWEIPYDHHKIHKDPMGNPIWSPYNPINFHQIPHDHHKIHKDPMGNPIWSPYNPINFHQIPHDHHKIHKDPMGNPIWSPYNPINFHQIPHDHHKIHKDPMGNPINHHTIPWTIPFCTDLSKARHHRRCLWERRGRSQGNWVAWPKPGTGEYLNHSVKDFLRNLGLFGWDLGFEW